MSKSLEERLQTHSSAFNGLLSLIPAKYYYDDATQDQWQQQKKSKKEIQENKRAKLDPSSKDEADDYTNSHASAKDVMSNKAKNAKRVNLPSANKFQQQKAAVSGAQVPEDDEDEEEEEEDVEIPDMDVSDGSDSEKNDSDDNLMPVKTLLIFDDEGNEVDARADAAASSGATGSQSQKQKKAKISPEEQQKRQENLAKLRAKLSDKINNMKEKRKAPGSKSSGVVPKSREQILADRKKKEELKRLEKLKRKSEAIEDDDSSDDEDDEEDQDQDGSNSVPSDVLFGNIVFGDGSRVTSDLTKLRATADKRKLKGPANNDLKAHLKKLEAKKARLLELSPEEQTKQKDKDQWNRVMAQAEGIKVKDDEKLLRKALKRKEKQKLKSEIEWRERKQVVKDTVAARAKRREENLKSRRENKGKKSKNQPKLKKFTGTINKSAPKKKRAGFEGSAKSQKKNSK